MIVTPLPDGDGTDGPRIAAFFERFCTLNKSFHGQPFVPLPWMKEFLDDVHRHRDGRRIIRTALLGMPRKNSKSTLASGLAAFHLIADDKDDAPEVWGAAVDKDQARIVFDMTKQTIQSSPELNEVCKVYRDVIECQRNGGTYRAASADAVAAHGYNPSCTIFDELHLQKNWDLYTALRSGSASRNNPITYAITTAGFDLETPLGEMFLRGMRVAAGEDDPDDFYMRWYGPALGEKVDVYNEANWSKWNPSWEIMNMGEVRSASKDLPEADFSRFHANRWTEARAAWLPMGAWDDCADPTGGLADGDRVIVGFDGAFAGDCTALVACRVEDLYLERVGFWERPKDDKAWRTPVADVEQTIREICDRYTVQEVVCDPWLFQVSLQRLTDEGYPMVEFATNGVRMVSPTKTFFDAVMDQSLSHNGDPTFARHIANTELKQDARGSRVTKQNKSSTRHIDLTVAAILALSRARAWREQETVTPAIVII